jgi:hypothetical protein
MQMAEFEKQITEILGYQDDEGHWLDEALQIYPAMDGCLSATYRGEGIPCEGYSWEEALDEIVKYIKKHRKPWDKDWNPSD